MEQLTSKEIQDRLGISRTTLFRLEKKGLPYTGYRSSKRYNIIDVEAWLKNLDQKRIDDLKVNKVYSNDDLVNIFGCSKKGDIRKSYGSNTIIFINNKYDSENNFDNDIFSYKISEEYIRVCENYIEIYEQHVYPLIIRILNESNRNDPIIHLFETMEEDKYVYKGKIHFLGTKFLSFKSDKNGQKYVTLKFKLKNNISSNIDSDNKLLNIDSNLQEELNIKKSKISKTYRRNVYISKFCRMRAKGICDLCGNLAPFNDKYGNPYLEVHHVHPLSEGGKDTEDNMVALCPNCHTKMHILELEEDIYKLNKKINRYKLDNNE